MNYPNNLPSIDWAAAPLAPRLAPTCNCLANRLRRMYNLHASGASHARLVARRRRGAPFLKRAVIGCEGRYPLQPIKARVFRLSRDMIGRGGAHPRVSKSWRRRHSVGRYGSPGQLTQPIRAGIIGPRHQLQRGKLT